MSDQVTEAITVLEETLEAQKKKALTSSTDKTNPKPLDSSSGLVSSSGGAEAPKSPAKPSQRSHRREEDFELINNLAELYITASQFDDVLLHPLSFLVST